MPVTNLTSRLAALLAAAVFSLVVALPFQLSNDPAARPFAWEVELATDAPGTTQLYFDLGGGFREADSARVRVEAGKALQTVRLALPSGTVRGLRFDPIDRPATVSFREARLVAENGKILRRFPSDVFRAQQQIASLTDEQGTIRVVTTPTANDPTIGIALDQPIELRMPPVLRRVLPLASILFAVLAVILLAASAAPAHFRQRLAEIRNGALLGLRSRPGRTVAIVALGAVALANYPVIFLGRSFVSPNISDGTFLLYERFPTLPGYDDPVTVAANGSDVGAIIWQQVPYSFIQHRALFRDRELPLWNRYNSCGSVLLGQGQTMFGDPFHLPVILADGAAWAWDLKYLVAKWLLCAGIGLTVLKLTRHLPSAVLAALAAAFVGFFQYRFNHPAVFSFCYSPWILFSWVGISAVANRRSGIGWCLFLVAANYCELTSGTVKEAYVLILGLNFSGAMIVCFTRRPWPERLLTLAGAVAACAVCALVAAPFWLTLKDALKQAYTAYDFKTAFQIHPSVALGFFDELFYRPLIDGDRVFNPGANFLVLTGVLYLVAAFRHIRSRPAVALAWSALPPAALVFGFVPPTWIIQVPFLANIAHIDNSFSCLLVILVLVLAGFGWQLAFARLGTTDGCGDLGRIVGWFALLVFPWIAFIYTVHRPIYGLEETFTLHRWGHHLAVTPFVWTSLLALTLAMALLCFVTRRALRHRRLDAVGVLLIATALVTLLWREGFQARGIGPSAYVFAPAVRAPFHYPSPAVAALLSDRTEPARALGLGSNLFCGWSSNYDIEEAGGADALANPHYRELVDALGLDRIWDWRIYLTAEKLAHAKPALDFLNVRYYATLPAEALQIGRPMARVASADLAIYRSDAAWPRAFFTSGVVPYEKPDELAALVRQPGVRPFAAVLRSELGRLPAEIAVLPRAAAAAQIRRAHDYHLTTNTTEFTVNAAGPGLAVLQEAWLPKSFRATVDGVPAPVLRVNHAFKAVAISTAGTHRIAFTYRPRRWSLALGLSAGGCGLLAASGLVLWRSKSGSVHPISA